MHEINTLMVELGELLDNLTEIIVEYRKTNARKEEVKHIISRTLNDIPIESMKKELSVYAYQLLHNKNKATGSMLRLVLASNSNDVVQYTASLLSHLLKKLGILSSGHLIEIDFACKAVNATSLLPEKIANAAGGILILQNIHEAVCDPNNHCYLRQLLSAPHQDYLMIIAGSPESIGQFIHEYRSENTSVCTIINCLGEDVERCLNGMRMEKEVTFDDTSN